MEKYMQAHAEKHGFVTPLMFHEAMNITDCKPNNGDPNT
jgi:hypothetical protein